MKTIELRHVSEPSWVGDDRVRRAFYAIMRQAVGLRWPDPKLAQFLFPHDTAEDAHEFSRKSDCATSYLATSDRAGVGYDQLAKPYRLRDGMAVAEVVQMYSLAGAWRDTTQWGSAGGETPDMGDAVLVGMNPPAKPADPAKIPIWQAECDRIRRAWGGVEHVRMAGEKVAAGLPFRCIQGGQGPTSTEVHEDIATWDVRTDGSVWSAGRRVRGWGSVVLLPLARPAQVPDDFDEAY